MLRGTGPSAEFMGRRTGTMPPMVLVLSIPLLMMPPCAAAAVDDVTPRAGAAFPVSTPPDADAPGLCLVADA